MPRRWTGVDTIYLRENDEPGANPVMEKLLAPYMEAGIVDFDYWPGPRFPAQTDWFNECTRLGRDTHSWFGYLDLDEFIVVLRKCASSAPLAPLSAS